MTGDRRDRTGSVVLALAGALLVWQVFQVRPWMLAVAIGLVGVFVGLALIVEARARREEPRDVAAADERRAQALARAHGRRVVGVPRRGSRV